jgi:hypothetical protein
MKAIKKQLVGVAIFVGICAIFAGVGGIFNRTEFYGGALILCAVGLVMIAVAGIIWEYSKNEKLCTHEK